LERTSDSEVKEILISRITINDKISQIMETLEAKERVTLENIFTEMREKIEMVVTFLALLELIRLKLVRIEQESNFSEIMIIQN